MKQHSLAILLTVLSSIVGTKAFAHDIEAKNSDGKTIYYIWTNNNTELGVSFRGNNYNDYDNEYSGDVVIPESVKYEGKRYKVTSIEKYAFAFCKEMTSISLPNTITIINAPFSHCSGLTSFTMPKSVEKVYGIAFNACNNLTAVHISDLSAWCRIQYEEK